LSFIRVTDRLQGKTARVATAGQGIARRTFAFVRDDARVIATHPYAGCSSCWPRWTA